MIYVLFEKDMRIGRANVFDHEAVLFLAKTTSSTNISDGLRRWRVINNERAEKESNEIFIAFQINVISEDNFSQTPCTQLFGPPQSL